MSYYPEAIGHAFRELLDSLTGQRVAILGHLRPDADCIGSQVALCRILNDRGVEALCLNHHPTPRVLEHFSEGIPWATPSDFDPTGWTAVAVDCADPTRFGPEVQMLFPEYLANIDHHRSNPGYARHNLIDPHSAATGEMLAGLLCDSGLRIDAVTAQALYVAMATDTGQFRYATTTPRVFELCAELLRLGASPALASAHLFENEPFAKIDLLRRFLESLTLELDGRVCIGTLPYGIFEETNTLKEDAEGFVDYCRDIAGVDIGLLLEEYEPGRTKGSLRAKTATLHMDALARQLNGGGHAAAAGFNINEPLDAVRTQVLAAIEAHLKACDSGQS